MAKVNAHSLPSVRMPLISSDFEDSLQPGEVLSLTFKPCVGLTSVGAMVAISERLITDFVKGRPDPDTGQPGPPAPIVDASGTSYSVDEGVCNSVAMLLAMQSPVDAEGQPSDTYDEMEYFLLAIAKMPCAIQNAFQFAGEWNEEIRTGKKTKDETPPPSSDKSPTSPASTPDSNPPSSSSDAMPSSPEFISDSAS